VIDRIHKWALKKSADGRDEFDGQTIFELQAEFGDKRGWDRYVGLSQVYKEMQKARDGRHDWEDKTWSLGDLDLMPEPLSAEAIRSVMQVWKHCVIWKVHLSRREAKWVARLHRVVDEIEDDQRPGMEIAALRNWAEAYAHRELMSAASSSDTGGTADLDSHLLFNGSNDVLAKQLGRVPNDALDLPDGFPYWMSSQTHPDQVGGPERLGRMLTYRDRMDAMYQHGEDPKGESGEAVAMWLVEFDEQGVDVQKWDVDDPGCEIRQLYAEADEFFSEHRQFRRGKRFEPSAEARAAFGLRQLPDGKLSGTEKAGGAREDTQEGHNATQG
jgi:hypothetical protein